MKAVELVDLNEKALDHAARSRRLGAGQGEAERDPESPFQGQALERAIAAKETGESEGMAAPLACEHQP